MGKCVPSHNKIPQENVLLTKKYRGTFSSFTGWGFVKRQPCARNDRLALGRPHMGLISPHFLFILSWQNNGCLWRVSYPLLSLSPRPKVSKFTQSNALGPCAKGQAKISCNHIGLWWNPISAVSLLCIIWRFPLSAFLLIIFKFKKREDWIEKQKWGMRTKVKPQDVLLRKRWDIFISNRFCLSQSNKTFPTTSVGTIQRQRGQQSVERSQQRARLIRKHGTVRP